MAERPPFQQKQYAFAAHIRDPANVEAPAGIEDRRMAVYRELFFNNLRSLLARSFPVLVKLVGDDGWRRLIREFMRHHRAQTPYFLELPREFVAFLDSGEGLRDDDFPFLAELAHYEYAELEVAIAEAPDGGFAPDENGDLLTGAPVLAAACRVYAYRWPVNRISPEFVPEAPSGTPIFIAIYRRPDDKVRFIEVNAMTAQLLERLADNPERQSGEQLLRQLAADIDYPDADAFVRHGAQLLQELRDSGVIAGTD